MIQMATEPIFKFFRVIAIAHAIPNIIAIRIHSSRMRTARLLMYPGEVCIGGLYLGGLLPGGSAYGVCLGVICLTPLQVCLRGLGRPLL